MTEHRPRRSATRRSRANGEGSIFPYRSGYAAYTWVTTPAGIRTRKYVYGKTRQEVHGKWLKLQVRARERPVATTVPTVEKYLTYWLADVVKPSLEPATYAYYEGTTRLHIIPGLGAKRLDRLTIRDVQAWLNTMPDACQCCGCPGPSQDRKY